MLSDRPTKGEKHRKKEIALKFNQIILTKNFFFCIFSSYKKKKIPKPADRPGLPPTKDMLWFKFFVF